MKIRIDFVSNSSSSSYIVSSALSPKQLGAKLFQCYKKISDKKHDWMTPAGKKLGECLYNSSAVTMFDISFNIPLTEEMKKKFYDGVSKSNMIIGGRCCSDSYLKKLFTKDGHIKDNVDPDPILNMLSWYHIKDGQLCFYDDDDECENVFNIHSGKITTKSIEFNRWLIKILEEKYPEIKIEKKEDFLKELDNLEKELETYFVYYLRVNHDGDGVDNDAAYYSNYGTSADYFDTLYREGAVVNMSWMDSM